MKENPAGMFGKGLLAAAAVLAVASSGAAGPVETVSRVDLDRYLGQWHELARFPNRFQRQCDGGVRATYAKRSDGRIDVINECRTSDGHMTDAKGVARVVEGTGGARLKVRFAPAFLSFLPMVWGDYWVIGLGVDYDWAVVGSPDRKYLWILSRTPSLDAEQWERAMERVRANGFEESRLVRTPR
jgi:apolipoprotein D and lipocalin family protein